MVCGDQRPDGFRAKVHAASGTAWAEVTAEATFQGFDGVLHGGAVTALLDDIAWHAAYSLGHVTMTAEISVRFRAPALVGRPLRVEARVVEVERRRVVVESRLLALPDRALLAQARATFLPVRDAALVEQLLPTLQPPRRS